MMRICTQPEVSCDIHIGVLHTNAQLGECIYMQKTNIHFNCSSYVFLCSSLTDKKKTISNLDYPHNRILDHNRKCHACEVLYTNKPSALNFINNVTLSSEHNTVYVLVCVALTFQHIYCDAFIMGFPYLSVYRP